MPEAVTTGSARRSRHAAWRWLGLLLLAALLFRVDMREVISLLRRVDRSLLFLAVAGLPPLILIKAARWRVLVRAQGARYRLREAFLAYFASLAVGFVTPGRLGEFIKALYLARDRGMPSSRAFSTVLADRLFDLYFLLAVGGVAIVFWGRGHGVLWFGLALLLTGPLLLFLHPPTFVRVRGWTRRWGRVGHLLAPGGWLAEVRSGLLGLAPLHIAVGTILTLLAYLLLYAQCYALACALGLPLHPLQTSFAVALCSLVTLLPISISGLGTREAMMVAYLAQYHVAAEEAVAFALLLFVALFVGGALMGLLAMVARPPPRA